MQDLENKINKIYLKLINKKIDTYLVKYILPRLSRKYLQELERPNINIDFFYKNEILLKKEIAKLISEYNKIESVNNSKKEIQAASNEDKKSAFDCIRQVLDDSLENTPREFQRKIKGPRKRNVDKTKEVRSASFTHKKNVSLIYTASGDMKERPIKTVFRVKPEKLENEIQKKPNKYKRLN